MVKGSAKILIASLGWLCVVLGVIGIFLPLLPTTPFLLLAAWLFTHSSERFHRWLSEHPKLGPIISVWKNGEGLDKSIRTRILICMWASMLLSALIIGKLWAVIMLTCIGAGVTAYICRLPIKSSVSS